MCTTSSQLKNNHAVIRLNQWLLVYSYQSLVAVAIEGGAKWYVLNHLTPTSNRFIQKTIRRYNHDEVHEVAEVELLSLLHHEFCSLNQEEK